MRKLLTIATSKSHTRLTFGDFSSLLGTHKTCSSVKGTRDGEFCSEFSHDCALGWS